MTNVKMLLNNWLQIHVKAWINRCISCKTTKVFKRRKRKCWKSFKHFYRHKFRTDIFLIFLYLLSFLKQNPADTNRCFPFICFCFQKEIVVKLSYIFCQKPLFIPRWFRSCTSVCSEEPQHAWTMPPDYKRCRGQHIFPILQEPLGFFLLNTGEIHWNENSQQRI